MRQSDQLRENVEKNTVYERVLVGSVGIILGFFFLLGVGFAGGNFVHDAAHDTRHINSFPCH